jgi:Mg2+ and Co2+ transporter CorA
MNFTALAVVPTHRVDSPFWTAIMVAGLAVAALVSWWRGKRRS